MRTADFDYELPPDRIAQTPAEPRDSARLMVLHRDSGTIEHRIFRDIVGYLEPGDLLVANDSRVIPARLHARKIPSGGRVELLLLNRHDDQTWEALVKGRRIRPGTKMRLVASETSTQSGEEPEKEALPEIIGEVLEITESGGRLIRFNQPVSPYLEALGETPLPPYIHQPLTDQERYQTVYARVRGSVAAPTAGLHFTPELIQQLSQRGIRFAFVTLHIGLDTFRPVQEEYIEEHKMHSEYAILPPETAQAIQEARSAGKRVVAVGTTVVRVLETAAARAAEAAGPDTQSLCIQPFAGWTNLFIYPGYTFRVVNAMITNFHLPRSTLLMLVSAFAGRDLILKAYHIAIEKGYRFYSFGDAMLIL